MDLHKKRVLVVGLGKSGIAAARYLVRHGAHVTVNDCQSASMCAKAFAQLEGCGIDAVFGKHDAGLVAHVDLVVVSPGVKWDLPLLKVARAQGIEVVSELEVALRHLRVPVIAVTGTNGKTTTTALIGHLLKEGGVHACVAGNIGVPLLDVLDEAMASDWVVLEVSSFQLESTPSLRPHIACLLNITADHLDRHASFEAYASLKLGLLEQIPPHGYGIYNDADPTMSARIRKSDRHWLPFHAAQVMRHGGWYDKGMLWTMVPPENARAWDLSDVQLHGIHNRENMLAALLATLCAGVHPDALQRGLASFQPLPHRVEFVGEVNGVKFYDDSKGTNVGATVQALSGLESPVVLIAGGQEKGGSYEPLMSLVKEKVKRLILIGEAAENMERALGGCTATSRVVTMDEAVEEAVAAATPGDVVLLSPACASFDMFENYAQRGKAFVNAVMHLQG